MAVTHYERLFVTLNKECLLPIRNQLEKKKNHGKKPIRLQTINRYAKMCEIKMKANKHSRDRKLLSSYVLYF